MGGYQFADIGYDRYYGGIGYLSMATPDVSWEISTKQDLGIDFSFLKIKYQVLLIIIMRKEQVFI